MSDPGRPFVPFLSRLQLERLGRAGIRREMPFQEELHGAVVFFDMVGFSSVTEGLGEEGPKGAEILSAVLQAYFEPVLEVIREHGGDVLYFAGDALCVLWTAASGEESDLADAALRAAQCALATQALIPSIDSPWGAPLRFRASLGIGALEALELGGEADRWMEVVRGEALDRARSADRVASAERVVVSEAGLESLSGYGASGEPLEEGHVALGEISGGVTPRPSPDPPSTEGMVDLVRAQLPEVVAARVGAGARGFLAEFRQVAVLFTNLLPPGEGGSVDLHTLHRAVGVVQTQIGRFEGVLDQVLEDDKGLSILAAFGLPGTSHADDPTRALMAARAIHEELRELGLDPASGVATGQVYSGVHGAEHRLRYSVMGSAINLAARLMTMAGDRRMLCDGATRKLASGRIAFEEAGWTTPKGFPAPVPLYEPTGVVETETELAEQGPVVGRAHEVALIAQALDHVLRSGQTEAVVIRGEAGIGKSTLIEAARRLSSERPVEFALCMADSFETGTAYYAFRSVARRWFGIEPGIEMEEGRDRAEATLASTPDLVPLVPLLGRILGLDFPESTLSDEVRGQARAETLRQMLLHVLRERAERSPLVLALEDGHWMDAASWALVQEIVEEVPRTLVVLTTRPLAEEGPELDALLETGRTRLIELTPIGRSETEAMIRAQLGVSEISPEALDLVCDRAEGNPFFAREVVRSLKESGGIRIRSSRVELVLEGVQAAPLPANLEGVITSRIDRLDPDVQVTVKVASVLGRAFEPRVLLGMHPERPSAEALESQLEALREATILHHEGERGGYAFHHALTHAAVYKLLPFAQREALHRAAAVRLEELHRDRLEDVQARLGYHYRMANLPGEAVPHLAAAGEAAVDAYAKRDAIELLETALELDEKVRGELEADVSRARWCRLIGQSYYNRDEQAEARRWYRRATEFAGTRPRGRVASVVPTLLQALTAPGRLGRPPKHPPDDQEREAMIEGLAAGRELSAVHLWENDEVAFALNVLNQARVARLLGPSSESADAITTLGYLTSVAGRRRAGEKIALDGVALAERVGDMRQITGTNTIAGMVLTQNGHALDALPLFEKADRTATALRAGMHRHRPKIMLADGLLWLGRYEEARKLFLEATDICRGAEPHAVGLTTALAALALLRMGRVEGAVSLLESPDGVPAVLEAGVVLSIVVGLGTLAEARLELGDREAALEAVRECESLLRPDDEGTSYFTSIFGHAALARVRLALNEPGAPQRRGARSRSPLALAIGRVAKLHRSFPGSASNLFLLRGLDDTRVGRARRARKHFRRAVAAAEAAAQPFELGRSLLGLARVSPDAERASLVQRAVEVFEKHGMGLESGRARGPLTRA